MVNVIILNGILFSGIGFSTSLLRSVFFEKQKSSREQKTGKGGKKAKKGERRKEGGKCEKPLRGHGLNIAPVRKVYILFIQLRTLL